MAIAIARWVPVHTTPTSRGAETLPPWCVRLDVATPPQVGDGLRVWHTRLQGGPHVFEESPVPACMRAGILAAAAAAGR
jgi:hypothetical protein